MTAEELIARLAALPPETPVLVEGYETGYDDIVNLSTQEVVQRHNAEEWDGEYDRNTNETCANLKYDSLGGLLARVVPDPQFDGESRDSTVCEDGENNNCAEKTVLSAVVILGRRGHLR